MLKVHSLYKQYKGKTILQQISFAVNKGEVLGIVGPNGAGKSTLLRLLSGIIDADGGTIFLEGKPLHIKDAAYWGYLPEERGLYPQMPVLDQLIYFAGLKGMKKSAAKIKATQLLTEWKMEQYLNAQASDLSKGNQQRIQFLSAILHDPNLIILDEPFSGLDPVQTDWLEAQIRLFRQQGKMVLYSSHRMDSVEALCDRVLVIHEGQQAAYGKVSDLYPQQAEIWEVVFYGGDKHWLEKVLCLQQAVLPSGEELVRFSLNEAVISVVVTAIENSGATIGSLKQHKPTLHELFVQLTSISHVAH